MEIANRNFTAMNGGLAAKRTRVNIEVALSFLALAGYPIVGIVVIDHMATAYGRQAQVGIGLVVFTAFFIFLKYWYRWLDRIQVLRRAYIRDNLRGIYRLKAPPLSQWTWCKENIRIGDYGWEMESSQKDNLIYLHGLSNQWQVVWMGGFRREDLEYVGLKPVSEYDWRDFEYEGRKPASIYSRGPFKAKTPCPFPVTSVTSEDREWVCYRFPI